MSHAVDVVDIGYLMLGFLLGYFAARMIFRR
jgi:hypothetical protein